MSNFFRNAIELHVNPKLRRPLLIGVFSMIAAIAGIVPNLSTLPSLTQTSVAFAQSRQEFNDEQILNYARAVLAIEQKRKQTYNDIREEVGEPVPAVICDETRSLNRLDGDARKLAFDYCEQAKRLIESNDLQVSTFNEITRQQETDDDLKQKIQEALQQLQ